jgi:hypothetical protein
MFVPRWEWRWVGRVAEFVGVLLCVVVELQTASGAVPPPFEMLSGFVNDRGEESVKAIFTWSPAFGDVFSPVNIQCLPPGASFM